MNDERSVVDKNVVTSADPLWAFFSGWAASFSLCAAAATAGEPSGSKGRTRHRGPEHEFLSIGDGSGLSEKQACSGAVKD